MGLLRCGILLAAVALVGASLAGCTLLTRLIDDADPPTPRTTLARHLPLAEVGSAESQNLIGVMSFFGDGAPRSEAAAYRWFRLAAEQGHAQAQRNLAVMHRLGAGVPRDDAEAERLFRRRAPHPWRTLDEMLAVGLSEPSAAPGERSYATLCAGCHGLNGIAAYVGSPSFALGERLDKSDAELLQSLRRGVGTMPGWEDKLPPAELVALVRFLRTFPHEYTFGIARVLRPPPPMFFLFGPMRRDDRGFRLQLED